MPTITHDILRIGAFAGFVLTTSLLSRPAEAAPIILEVFYDASGADTGRVFTGIYGEAGMSLDG